MSADVWLEIDTGGPEPSPVCESRNITYNLTPMLAEAGFPGHGEMVGLTAAEAGPIYQRTADTLLSDPDRFKKLNPSNGWGDYDGAVVFCRAMADQCAQHSRAVVGAWL